MRYQTDCCRLTLAPIAQPELLIFGSFGAMNH